MSSINVFFSVVDVVVVDVIEAVVVVVVFKLVVVVCAPWGFVHPKTRDIIRIKSIVRGFIG